ncbi:hypothetical protein LCGC14_2562940 [marine sediment metagenome]|uniref:Tyr recombinase domain-containing protein n=1 Tax=marine sediment metagenome TaxID=412755 RepID=A0A0F9AK50_9ZZZZ
MPRRTYHYRGNNPKSRKTWGQAAYEWLKQWDGKDFRRQKDAVKVLLPHIGTVPLCNLNNASFEGYKEAQQEKSASTINLEIGIALRVVRFAVEILEWHDYVPFVKTVKGTVRVVHPLTWEQQDRLFAHAKPWWVNAYQFAVNTGIRPNEMFGLKWNNIEPFMDGMIAVPEETKNGHKRAVIVNSLGKLAVERQKKYGGKYIFCSQSYHNKGGRVVSWGSVWPELAEKAGLPKGDDVRGGIYVLRHTTAYRLGYVGAPSEIIGKFLGHANANITEHYTTRDLGVLMEWGEKITVRPQGKELMLCNIGLAS